MSNKYEDLIKNARMNADCGEHMSPEEVTTLLNVVETTFAALAAENAGLKDINAWCKTDAFKNMYREFKAAEALGCHDVDCMHDAMLTALMHAPETPATDAVLAEVRAQGVEMAAQSELFSTWVQQGLRSFAIGVRQGDEPEGGISKGVQS